MSDFSPLPTRHKAAIAKCSQTATETELNTRRYRKVILPDFPKHLVTVKFILGTPALPEKPISSEAIARTKLMNKVSAEMQENGDMVMLPVRPKPTRALARRGEARRSGRDEVKRRKADPHCSCR